jgi:uncharacterized protein (DUF1800 family)
MDDTLRALNRFGLGARRGERQTIRDARGWLRAQLDAGPPTVRAPEAAAPGAIGDALRSLRLQGRSEAERREARRRIVEIGAAEMRAALVTRVTTERPFVERLVAFWSNHLCVSTGAKAMVAPLAGSYERDVIRAHVLGSFEDMVMASARHPAMLLYLDNAQSIGPASPAARLGQRAGANQRGLNENYARELLELHTLGVNGGYTQQDVQELARVFTGWTVDGIAGPGARGMARGNPSRPGGATAGRGQGARPAAPQPGAALGFVFRGLLHEPGSKVVLGQRYDDAGVQEGERVIRALCRHPSTARFVSTKLVSHFVSDEPPPAAVDRVEKVFRSTNGDLRVMARALVDEPDAWRDGARKFRSPQDWLVAVMRAGGATDVNANAPALLRQLRQPLWSPQSPKGFGDSMQEWADPDSLLNRGELARTLSRTAWLRELDPRSLLDVVDVPDDSPLRTMLADHSILPDERIALALAGPAFQWR